jgi:hypothetical protein
MDGMFIVNGASENVVFIVGIVTMFVVLVGLVVYGMVRGKR